MLNGKHFKLFLERGILLFDKDITSQKLIISVRAEASNPFHPGLGGSIVRSGFRLPHRCTTLAIAHSEATVISIRILEGLARHLPDTFDRVRECLIEVERMSQAVVTSGVLPVALNSK